MNIKHLLQLIFFLLSIGVMILLVDIVTHSSAESGDPVIATVNNVPVPKSQLDLAIEAYKSQTNKKQVTDDEKSKMTRSLITRQLILNLEEVDLLRKDKNIVSKVKEFENQLVIKSYIDRKIGNKITVTDEEIRIYYQNNLNEFINPPKVLASHILLRDNDKAMEIKERLKQGESFDELVKKYSIDLPMALEGGSMGTIEKGKSLPELEKVLFLLKEGEISEIVTTRYGSHILRVDKIYDDKYKAFDEVKDHIQKKLLLQKEAKAFDDMALELEKGSDIKIFNDLILGSAP
ncbi:putative Foldase protein PrsA [uncultured Desulfobacterium sp.]|uniref:Putative Foldase protein PrsA n=1 Tax=uncultured Desulfobacterium sp. TaxID=201089 RepID=A0A445MSU0_9BACT|nr:putative Foldase protein PrsA [uncultured Desulfobacterium sp.]